jgi:hypothetical protein
MNLVNLLLKEYSKAQGRRIVKYVGNDASRFAELVKVYVEGPYRITQRAALPLTRCSIHNPKLVRPHLNKLLAYVVKPRINDAVKRNTLRLLQFVPIPKSLQGKTADLCFMFLSRPKEPIAVRVFAMTVLANMAKENPEMKNEIIPLIEDQLPFGSAGFKNRGMKVLRMLSS